MIRTFRHKGLEQLFVSGHSRRIDAQLHDKLLDLLDILNAATAPRDLAGVAGFHGLKGKRKGEYAMTVTANRRLTFRFRDNDVVDVNFEDYH